jgi:hypothetical protein
LPGLFPLDPNELIVCLTVLVLDHPGLLH